MGFLEQFLDVFGELKGKDFYVSGESVGCAPSILFSRALTDIDFLLEISSMLAFVSSIHPS